MRPFVVVVGLLALGGGACAQCFNVDFNASSGFASGSPTSTFGGLAAQPGPWNAVPATGPGPFPLVDTRGQNTGVAISRSGSAVEASFNSPQTTGDFERLLDDFQRVPAPNGTTTLTITGLQPGDYVLTTYAISPGSDSERTRINVFPTTSSNPQNVGGAMPNNGFIVGTTHSLHSVPIRVDAPTLSITVTPFIGAGSINGLQIRLMAALSNRIYVDAAATGAAHGGSWADAYPSLQTALAAAANSGGVIQEIWVARGTYKPTTGTLRTAKFLMTSNLAIYGGFAGTETSLDQRNIAANPTRLSGLIGGGQDNQKTYQLVDASNLDETAILDGFILENANANGVSPFNTGAGIYSVNGSPTIRNCTFLGLKSSVTGAGLASRLGSPVVSNCRFINSQSTGGAAVFHSLGGTLTLVNCRFHGSAAGDFGGAVQLFNGQMTLVNCFFTGNHAAAQGGAAYIGGASGLATFINCTIVNNSSASTGGIKLVDGADATLINSIVFGNTDTDGATSVQGAQLASAVAGSVFTLTRNAVQGWTGSLGGTGNMALASSPFANLAGTDGIVGTGDDDGRLAEPPTGSPCIDAGSNALVAQDIADLDGDGNTSEPVPVDLAGAPRFVDVAAVADTGVGPAPVVDLGAFEFQASAPPPPACGGDANNDRRVDGADLSVLLFMFGQTVVPGTGADFNIDGVVDGADLSVLLFLFGTEC